MSNKDKIKIYFVGENAKQVTGSATLVKTKDVQFLVDFGLAQGNSLRKDFDVNSKIPKEIKAKKIDYVFITHTNADHFGKLPLLAKYGFSGKVIVPKGNKEIIKRMLLDSAYIIERDANYLDREPFYDKQDVYSIVRLVEEYDFGKHHKLGEFINFNFLHAGHILNSAQIEIDVKSGMNKKKILFTGDLGNITFYKPFVERLEPCRKANIVVGECTYARDDRSVKSYQRDKDKEKLKTIIRQTTEAGGNVFIPSFSLDRTQTLLYILYELLDDDFPYNVIVDSPLSVDMTNMYPDLITNGQSGKMKKILEWDNLILCKDHKDHELIKRDGRPKIILSSSGMMTAGRSVSWAERILPDKNSEIVFVGFAVEGSLASKIKDRKQKGVTINGKRIRTKCGVTILNSFSSHMQHDDLLKYYTSINGAESIYLVHGNMDDKINFSKELQDKIHNNNKTTNVVCVNKSTVATI